MRSHGKKRPIGSCRRMRVNNPMAEQLCTETDKESILGGQSSVGLSRAGREFPKNGIIGMTCLPNGHRKLIYKLTLLAFWQEDAAPALNCRQPLQR
jgi:hypothetical protein